MKLIITDPNTSHIGDGLGITPERFEEIVHFINVTPVIASSGIIALDMIASVCNNVNELAVAMFIAGKLSYIPPKNLMEQIQDQEITILN